MSRRQQATALRDAVLAYLDGRYHDAHLAIANAPPSAQTSLLRLSLQINEGRYREASVELKSIDPLSFERDPETASACLFAAYGSYVLNLVGEHRRAILYDTTMRVYAAFADDPLVSAEAHLVHSYIVPQAAEAALAEAYALDDPRLHALAHRFDANRSMANADVDAAAVHAYAGLQAMAQMPEPERGLQSDLLLILSEAVATIPGPRRIAQVENIYNSMPWTADLIATRAICATNLARAVAATGDLFLARRLCRDAANSSASAPLRIRALAFAAQIAGADRDYAAHEQLTNEIRRVLNARIEWSAADSRERPALLEAAALLAPSDEEGAKALVARYDQRPGLATFEAPARAERLYAAVEALLRGRISNEPATAASYLTEALTLAIDAKHPLVAAEAAAYLHREGVSTPAVMNALNAGFRFSELGPEHRGGWLARLGR